MPSIQDVADQINAKLDQINSNTASTAQNTADIKSELQQVNVRLAQIDHSLDEGFSNLGHGLLAIAELHKLSIAILNHHSAQNDTLICLLENNNELLCGITRKFTRQLMLSEEMLQIAERIEGIEEQVHAEEAIDYDRRLELQAAIEKCCPPDEEEPGPCPEDCKVPKFRPPKPKGQDWKPLPAPKTKPTG